MYECDAFTREYLTSEGIEVNPNETAPPDNFAQSRTVLPQTYTTPSTLDKYGKFLTLDRHVLRFFAIWDDREQLFGEARKFLIHFYLSDDTMEIKEVHEANNGRDPFPTLVARQRMAKAAVPKTFPSVERTIVAEGSGFFEASDLIVGQTIDVGSRKMFIYDADAFTRKFTTERLGVEQPAPQSLNQLFPADAEIVHKLPDYNGFGTLEDSEQNCKKIVPDRPKKNYIKMLVAGNEKLRFEAVMLSSNDADQNRKFIISIRLSDDMIAIQEIQSRNSGLSAGRFLEYSRIPKPGSSINSPVYYGVNDFAINNTIIAFSHRFKITGCDLHVLKWIEAHPEAALDAEFVSSIRTIHKAEE